MAQTVLHLKQTHFSKSICVLLICYLWPPCPLHRSVGQLQNPPAHPCRLKKEIDTEENSIKLKTKLNCILIHLFFPFINHIKDIFFKDSHSKLAIGAENWNQFRICPILDWLIKVSLVLWNFHLFNSVLGNSRLVSANSYIFFRNVLRLDISLSVSRLGFSAVSRLLIFAAPPLSFPKEIQITAAATESDGDWWILVPRCLPLTKRKMIK